MKRALLLIYSLCLRTTNITGTWAVPSSNLDAISDSFSELNSLGVNVYMKPESDFTLANGYILQAKLDDFCWEQFQKLCALGITPFCTDKVYARKGMGREDQLQEQWRCYHGDSVDLTRGFELFCVENCGNSMPCPGIVRRQSSLHLSIHSILTRQIEILKKQSCSKSQNLMNEYCAKLSANQLARKSASRSSSSVKWRCLDKRMLHFDIQSICTSSCKTETVCPGGLSLETTPFDAYTYERDHDLKDIIKTSRSGCGDKRCLEKLGAPQCG